MIKYDHYNENYNQDLKPCIFDLPNEIIFQIFSYLDSATLASKIQLVCKYWYELSCDPALWTSLSFKGNGSIAHISKVLPKYPSIQKLKIFKGMLNSSILKAISSLPYLEEFSLTECYFFIGAETAFRNVLINTSIKTLNLKNGFIGDSVMKFICEAKNLKILRITSIEHQYLIPILERCELTHLEIDKNNYLSEDGIDSIFTIRSSKLESLILNGEKRIEDSAFAHIDKCHKLSTLSVSRSDNILDETLFRLSKLPAIKHLSLSYGSSFTAEGFKRFFSGNNAIHLRYIDLTRCCKLDDECVCIIAVECKNILTLCVKYCSLLTDKSISQVVRCCIKLEHLDVSWIQSLRGRFLGTIKDELKCLQILDLRSCSQIEKSLIKSLECARPSLKIYK